MQYLYHSCSRALLELCYLRSPPGGMPPVGVAIPDGMAEAREGEVEAVDKHLVCRCAVEQAFAALCCLFSVDIPEEMPFRIFKGRMEKYDCVSGEEHKAVESRRAVLS